MALFFIIGGLFQLISSMVVAMPGCWQAADGFITLILGQAGWSELVVTKT